MQKHEVVQTQSICAAASVAVGACASLALSGHVPLPFPAGTVRAIQAAFHEPLMLWGALPGTCLAAYAWHVCREQLFDGFEGARYAKFIRGTRMLNRHQLDAKIRAHNKRYQKVARKRGDEPRPPVKVCGVEMPTDLETQNIMIVGAPGTGKSQAIQGLIASALDRGDRMVTVDPNGSMCSRFFLPGDIIINPYDRRCVGWSLFNEAGHDFDFDRVSHSAIPPQVGDQAEEWAGYARFLLSDTMTRLHNDDMPDMRVLVDLTTRERRDVLAKFHEQTGSAGFFAKDAERATASIIFTLNKYIRPLIRIPDGDFSIRKWMRDENAGNIWITWREDQRTALGPTIPIWLDLVFAMILSDAPSFSRRLWVNMDELASIGRLYSFEPAVSKGRKHGLCVVGGLQDVVQLKMNLGQDPADAALACFRSLLALGGANAHTTKRLATMLGSHDVERHPIGVNPQWWNLNTRERKIDRDELLVTPSELANLPDLQGYLKYGKDWPLTKVKFGARDYPVRHPDFLAMDLTAIANLIMAT
ncbi:TPA: type IV secretion system DNA-binding domain-containing protein [Burkholderia vietnamiensis]|nr:type IV secretion system DNA-binding domain-containing protein [Burkholderia cenocepacia]HDR8918757.1 type IV secretion system DNA-binding domain-containing protein [Burkholderia vietnamiensis]HDR8976947.1 type IV secretion system DNA-binding domain-containing protein [Burkholderia vietnamiensis]HDR9049912.1 type IV secretion system DNA-binding domain-containing protein [Burkholderia vietnamiensis]HDR9191183.1 type IV secretion system DNA-binding domain-containing protein [Burkholderia vietn